MQTNLLSEVSRLQIKIEQQNKSTHPFNYKQNNKVVCLCLRILYILGPYYGDLAK